MKCFSAFLRFGFPAFLFFYFAGTAFAQWTPAARPGSERLYRLANANGVWLCLAEYGLYRSTDDGHTWSPTITPAYYHTGICGDGNSAWAYDSEAGLFHSVDQGLNWALVSDGPFVAGNLGVNKVVATDQYVVVAGYRTVFQYDKADPKMEKLLYTGAAGGDLQLVARGNDLWVATSDSLLRSTDDGDSWSLVRKGWSVQSFDMHGDTILALLKNATCWRSPDYGNTWAEVASLTGDSYIGWQEDRWFAHGYNKGLRSSLDDGQSWQVPGAGVLEGRQLDDVRKQGGTTLALSGNWGYGLLRSDNDGQYWSAWNNGFASDSFWPLDDPAFYPAGDNLVMPRFFSANMGQSWYFPIYAQENALSITMPIVSHQGYYYAINQSQKIYRSNGDFNHWTYVTGPLLPGYTYELLSTGNRLLRIDRSTSSIASSNIYESTDGGVYWSPVSVLPSANIHAQVLAHQGALFRWQTNQGLFRSDDAGISWQPTGAGLGDFLKFSTDAPRLFSDGKTLFVYYSYLITASVDNGLTFKQINKNLHVNNVPLAGADHLFSDGNLLVIANSYGVFIAPGINDQWFHISSDLPMSGQGYLYNPAVAIHKGRIFVADVTLNPPVWSFAIADLLLAEFSGKVWRDDNNNGLQDPGEPPFAGALLQAGTGSYATSQADGQYQLFAQLDQDTLRVVKPKPWVEVAPPFYQVSGSAAGRDFGLYFPPDITDLSVMQTNLTVFRPGFTGKIHLDYGNNGTRPADARLHFVAGAPLEILDAAPPPDEMAGDTLVWLLKNLLPEQVGKMVVTIRVPAGVPIGDMVGTFAEIIPDFPDAYVADNRHTLAETVVGALDPNDKQCTPADQISPAQIANREPLIYTIRFQNTGTYPAAFVRLADTLSPNLDVSTFRLLSASHPCNLDIRGAGILSFVFDPIDLPPSGFNEPESHGFVKYSIQPKANLNLGEIIRNTAYIYFDFNPPVVTNTTKNEVALPVPVHSPTPPARLTIFPNPTDGPVWIRTDSPGHLRIFDALGRPVAEQSVAAGLQRLDLSKQPAGVYLLHWQDETGTARTGKVVKKM